MLLEEIQARSLISNARSNLGLRCFYVKARFVNIIVFFIWRRWIPPLLGPAPVLYLPPHARERKKNHLDVAGIEPGLPGKQATMPFIAPRLSRRLKAQSPKLEHSHPGPSLQRLSRVSHWYSSLPWESFTFEPPPFVRIPICAEFRCLKKTQIMALLTLCRSHKEIDLLDLGSAQALSKKKRSNVFCA